MNHDLAETHVVPSRDHDRMVTNSEIMAEINHLVRGISPEAQACRRQLAVALHRGDDIEEILLVASRFAAAHRPLFPTSIAYEQV